MFIYPIYNHNWRNIITIYIYTGCPNKSARFNFEIKAPFIQNMPTFLFQYKVHTLRFFVEHNIRQMSPTTLLNCGGRQWEHFKFALFLGHPHITRLASNEIFSPSKKKNIYREVVRLRIYQHPCTSLKW